MKLLFIIQLCALNLVASSFIVVNRGFTPFFDKAIVGDSFWKKLFAEELPSHHDLKLGEWEGKKRVITLYDMAMGKKVYHVKTQSIESSPGSDIFELRDETLVKGCVNMKIDTHWKISDKDGVNVTCKVYVQGFMSKMLTPVVTRAVKKSLDSIIDMDISSLV